MNRRLLLLFIALTSLLFVYGMASAATITLTPDDYTYDEQAPREVKGDSVPGWGTGSWQGPISGKSNMHLTWDDELNDLFDRSLTVGDLSEISWYTKSAAGSNENWWLTIYTKSTDGDDSTWYDIRYHAYANSGTGDWVFNSTNDIPFNTYPSSGEKNLSQLIEAYGTQEILSITFQSNSGWDGFDGQLDGVTITLTDQSVGSVDFEPVPEPATMTLLGIGLLGLAGLSRKKK